MLLSAKSLTGVCSVNSFSSACQLEMSEGDQVTAYFQLIDASLDKVAGGRRYMPAVGSTLQIVLMNINTAKTYTKNATQPYPTSDPSIWAITISATDDVKGTINVQLVLTEGSTVKRGLLPAGIRVYPVAP
jgi:hypothetical protein